MLFNKLPFEYRSCNEILEAIRKGNIDFTLNDGKKISPALEQLLRSMLKYKPQDRIKWEDLFTHELFKK